MAHSTLRWGLSKRGSASLGGASASAVAAPSDGNKLPKTLARAQALVAQASNKQRAPAWARGGNKTLQPPPYLRDLAGQLRPPGEWPEVISEWLQAEFGTEKELKNLTNKARA